MGHQPLELAVAAEANNQAQPHKEVLAEVVIHMHLEQSILVVEAEVPLMLLLLLMRVQVVQAL
jgi:hypothetical protein